MYKLTAFKIIWVTILTTMMLSYTPTLLAIQPLQPLASDSRIKIVAYNANDVVPVSLNLMTSTQFILNKDEHIADVQTGDAAAWIFDNKNLPPYMFFLKPAIAGSNTNVTVVTDKRNYYFNLLASDSVDNHKTTYVVRFIYPEEEKLKILREEAATLNLSKNPSEYNWSYSFNGTRTILPLHIFDDGQFTYFELRNGQPVPAIFAVDNIQGHESVVNFRRQNNYLIVERIAPQFTLRNGSYAVASIFNDKLIKSLKSGS